MRRPRLFDRDACVCGRLSARGGDAGTETAPPWFEEIAARAGIDFVHRSGHDSRHYLPEIMGGGAALFDMDNDGLLDLYLVQSGNLFEPIGGRRATACIAIAATARSRT